ncbi:prepilin peptidase [Trinickia sp.]|uniref:prepilin peptidase n=1 Tax=Trinickia sp. TaxID=2571163 RepID=UPI003F802696
MIMHVIDALASAFLSMLALSDLRRRRLPNAIVAAFAALYVAHAWLSGATPIAFELHLVTGVAALVLAAALFGFGWLGGGDAKLFGAVFLWSGPAHAATVFFIVSLFGLMLALAQIAVGRMQRDAAPPGALAWLAPSHGVPYGLALAVGAIAAVWLPASSTPAHTLALLPHLSVWPLSVHVRLT